MFTITRQPRIGFAGMKISETNDLVRRKFRQQTKSKLRNSQNDFINSSPPDQQVLQLLLDAIQEHLPSDAIDEAKVREIVAKFREIVATEIAEANLPRPIEVRLPYGKLKTIEVEGS